MGVMVVPVAAPGDAAQLRSRVFELGAPSGQNGSSSRRIRPIKIAAFPEAWCGKPCRTVGEKPDWDQTRARIGPGSPSGEPNRGLEVDTTQDREVRIPTTMKGTARLVWLLVTLTVILMPMAWAIPIDPSWIKGVYDGGDFDDVVSFLTSGTLEVPVLPAADLSPVFVSAPTEALADQPTSVTPRLSPQLVPHPSRGCDPSRPFRVSIASPFLADGTARRTGPTSGRGQGVFLTHDRSRIALLRLDRRSACLRDHGHRGNGHPGVFPPLSFAPRRVWLGVWTARRCLLGRDARVDDRGAVPGSPDGPTWATSRDAPWGHGCGQRASPGRAHRHPRTSLPHAGPAREWRQRGVRLHRACALFAQLVRA